MPKIDIYMLREAWGRQKTALSKLGYSLRRGVSFEELEARISNSKKPSLTEHFSTEKNTYTPDCAFWIAIETASGENVGRVCTRVDRLGELSLLEYWRKYWKRCYPGGLDGQAELAEVQPRFATRIIGDVAYIGDLYIEPDHRRSGIGSNLVKLVQIDALDEWMPDFLYGWMTPEHIASSLFHSYGFTNVHVDGIHWKVPPATIGGNLAFVGNSRDDLADLLLTITKLPPAQENT
ncbi:GNAT family N-acetyltransferase [Labrenzia sp. DG1229]|uniref:GNAT family N-acetyltransferase n=1 Tax=Labrenzia sp. DG1229 TaxID=681847 RepID=UPI000691217D|nr:GNAT family N-acetyltransferase [Labrenzia sp. DG1229]